MTLKDKSDTINIINGGIRLCQIILSAAVIGVYAYWLKQWGGNDVLGLGNKLVSHCYLLLLGRSANLSQNLGIAAGSLSIITGLAFGIIPFLVS